jgi:hypothetical protein
MTGRQIISQNTLVKTTFDWINRSTFYRQILRFSEQKLGNLIPQCCRVSLRGNRRSRLASVRLAQRHAVRDILDLEAFQEEDLYHAMDWLEAHQPAIETALFQHRYRQAGPASTLYSESGKRRAP